MAILEKTLQNKVKLFDFLSDNFKTIKITVNQQDIKLNKADFKDEDALYDYLLNLLHPKITDDIIDD